MSMTEGPEPDATDPKSDAAETIAVVIPLYNERENAAGLFQRFRDLAAATPFAWKLIFVDDGSTDGTIDCLIEEFSRPVDGLSCQIIELSRNFGKETALAVGFRAADCDLVATVDADLQDPPELIAEMLEMMNATGADVVCGKRASRAGESWLRRAGAFLYYRIAWFFSDIVPDMDVGDFRLMRRQVVDSLGRFEERNRFMKSIYTRAGFRRVDFLYDREPRAGGTAKLSLMPLIDLAIDGITSLSIKPLRISTYIGLIVFFGALIYAIFLIARVALYGIDVPGYASLMVVLLTLNGFQFLLIGLMGEYIGRVLVETKRRPIGIVRSEVHLPK
jgi:glycosyltransferase involved in cell wall biosynthesis